jgi:endonuclease YncB( thermonuclease family)
MTHTGPFVAGVSFAHLMLAITLTVATAGMAPAMAEAAQLQGEVVGLSDGDTVTVLDASRTQHRVRLAGIDAPEKSQPFGNRARQHLADLVFRKQVVVEWSKYDRYGRVVGKVLVKGRDAGLAQVAAGLAWHYRAYLREQKSEDQISYAAAEEAARRQRLGLWREPMPTPPWDFRRARRTR